MATPRFRDLSPEEAASVVDAFLGNESAVEFTEKVAGQNFTATVNPDRSIDLGVKSSGAKISSGVFPSLEAALKNHHPSVDRSVTYKFEVVKKEARPDFIEYPLTADVTAIEFSGAMTRAVAESLNSGQDEVKFLVKRDIVKDVKSLVSDPMDADKLRSFRDEVLRGSRPSKAVTHDVENILMGLVDSGKSPSSLGGGRIEGLFGMSGGRSFKFPSRAYADLQLMQAKFYAVVKSNRVRNVVGRFESAVDDPMSDRAVSDVIEYIDKFSATPPLPGFRVFFKREELQRLKAMLDKYMSGDASTGKRLASEFFRRVANKSEWVSSNEIDSGKIEKNESKQPVSNKYRHSLQLLREAVRQHIGNMRKSF